MQVSFGHGLVKAGNLYFNPDVILRLEEAKSNGVEQTKICYEKSFKDYVIDAPVSKVAAACVKAQAEQRIVALDEVDDSKNTLKEKI